MSFLLSKFNKYGHELNEQMTCGFTILSQNKLEGDVGDIVSLQAQTSPYLQLREKSKCIEHIDEGKTQLITSP